MARTRARQGLNGLHREARYLRHTAHLLIAQWRAFGRELWTMPRLRVTLSADVHGDAVRDGLSFCQPWPARRRAVGTLTLPGSMQEYLRGRSMQAVRTNRRRAQEQGLVAFPARSREHARLLLATLLAHHTLSSTIDERLAGYIEQSVRLIWCVAGPDGVPLGMAVVALDGSVAQLSVLQIATDVEQRSEARYLLSTEIVAGLIAVGATHLFSDSMLLVPPGVVYLQRRLGFEPVHVTLVAPRRPRLLIRGRPGAVPASRPAGGPSVMVRAS